jgi:hypothetical protein
MMVGFKTGDIMQEAGRAHNPLVGSFYLCNVLRQSRHAQDVIKCVYRIIPTVQLLRLFNRDLSHRLLLELYPLFLV